MELTFDLSRLNDAFDGTEELGMVTRARISDKPEGNQTGKFEASLHCLGVVKDGIQHRNTFIRDFLGDCNEKPYPVRHSPGSFMKKLGDTLLRSSNSRESCGLSAFVVDEFLLSGVVLCDERDELNDFNDIFSSEADRRTVHSIHIWKQCKDLRIDHVLKTDFQPDGF